MRRIAVPWRGGVAMIAGFSWPGFRPGHSPQRHRDAKNSLRLCAFAVFFLTGCAAPTFTPFTVEIANTGAFRADLAVCQKYAAQYRQSLSPRRVLESSVVGASSNAPTAVATADPGIGAAVIGLGAASAVGNEVAAELGLIDLNVNKITASCLHDKGERSGLYHVIDPNL
jgi:hypothetical protein